MVDADTYAGDCTMDCTEEEVIEEGEHAGNFITMSNDNKNAAYVNYSCQL